MVPPPDTPCPYCGRAGFVRFETIIANGQSYKHYYCGACNRTWQKDASDRAVPLDPSKERPPRRSSDT